MPYRHPAARIHEIVKAPKALVAGQSVSAKKRGSHGLRFEAFVEIDGLLKKRFAMSTFAAPLTPATVRQLLYAYRQEPLEIAKTSQEQDERSRHRKYERSHHEHPTLPTSFERP